MTVRLGVKAEAADLSEFDEVILACGIVPRTPDIPGIGHAKVLSYLDVLRDKKPVGQRVAIVGAGGIGFDTAEYLSQHGVSSSLDQAEFNREWGIDGRLEQRGGLAEQGPQAPRAARQIYLLQRKTSKVGEGLGKTTGWIHRASLAMRGVKMLNSVSYRLIDDEGLHITRAEQDSCLPVDTVVICAGQEPRRELQQPLLAMGKTVHLIGGADVAAELDARRAIDQGTRLAMAL